MSGRALSEAAARTGEAEGLRVSGVSLGPRRCWASTGRSRGLSLSTDPHAGSQASWRNTHPSVQNRGSLGPTHGGSGWPKGRQLRAAYPVVPGMRAAWGMVSVRWGSGSEGQGRGELGAFHLSFHLGRSEVQRRNTVDTGWKDPGPGGPQVDRSDPGHHPRTQGSARLSPCCSRASRIPKFWPPSPLAPTVQAGAEAPGQRRVGRAAHCRRGAGRGTRVGTKCSLCQGSKDRPPQICRVLGPKELNVEKKRG